MKRLAVILVATVLLSAGHAWAEDTPDKILQTSEEASQKTPAATAVNLNEKWRAFVEAQGWPVEDTENGVLHAQDKIIASAKVSVNIGLGQPGWVESRVVAYERAEMEAKAKIIRSLVETTETKRTLAVLENAVFQDGDIDKIKDLNEVAETLDRIGKKALALTEGSLDSALRKLDPDYDPEKYKKNTPEDLKIIVQNQFTRQVRGIAMKTLIGVTPIYSAEARMGGNEYQVLVGVIWSPKLNQLALSLMNDEYNIPVVGPGKPLAEHLPSDEAALIGTMGTRIVVDDKGHYAVMAYGQAQPRKAAVGRELAALQDASQIAANRARAALVNFIQEGLTLRESELGDELTREFSDMTVGTELVRDYRKIISGKNVKVKLSGLRVIKEWDAKHPETGQPVAGTVIAWSPSSASVSKEASATMDNQAAREGVAAPQLQKDSKPIESMKVDTSAY